MCQSLTIARTLPSFLDYPLHLSASSRARMSAPTTLQMMRDNSRSMASFPSNSVGRFFPTHIVIASPSTR